jgi:quercetin dioxygenase-like cupin family protein
LPRHQHLMVEELFVLEGDCHIASEQVVHAGDYFRAEGGSIHGTTYTEAGTTFLTSCLNDF